MIAFDLCCANGHCFEGWFGSSTEYETQRSGGLLTCPVCDGAPVEKMLSVPNIGRKGNHIKRPETSETVKTSNTEDPSAGSQMVNTPMLPPAMTELFNKMAAAQTEMLKQSHWVGRQFAEAARAIHYGETDNRLIHGEVSRTEAAALVDEGVAVAPLLMPFVPPEAKN